MSRADLATRRITKIMNRTSKKIVTISAEILNKRLAAGGLDHDSDVVDILNEILVEVAEGGRLVVARETNGEMLGFVPRSDIPIPETKPERPPKNSPDSKS